MTAFQFMVNAFYGLVGVACVAVAAIIVYTVAVAIVRGIRSGGRKNGKR